MSTIPEEVTLSVQMCEPGTVCGLSTLDLALASCVGESVMSYDVVLCQLTCPFLYDYLAQNLFPSTEFAYHKV